MRPTIAALSVVLAVALSGSHAIAAVSITPAYLEVRLDEGRPSGQFIISNAGDAQERYRVQSIHFTFTPDGALQAIEPGDYSLSEWVVFNPKELTLPPKTTRAVRFVIAPKRELQPGEYWGGMELESLNTSTGSGTDAGGREMRIEVVPKILVTIFGIVGKPVYSGTIGGTRLVSNGSSSIVETTLTNTGSGRLLVSGTYEVSDPSGRVVSAGPLQKGYVFRDCHRKIKAIIKEPVEAGSYAIRVKLESPQLKEALSDDVVQDFKPGG